MFIHKYLVKGNTLRTCKDICGSKALLRSDMVCSTKHGYYHKNRYYYERNTSQCMFKEKLNTPKSYVVAETDNGKWVCNCKHGIFRKVNGNSNCDHVYEVRCNPEKYEIPVIATATAIAVAEEL